MMYLSDIQSEVATWCNHDPTPDPIITIKYGALYNWYAATDARNICSAGWHIPTDNEWIILRDYLGGFTVAGGKLKETGIIYWNAPNTGATNEVGFNFRGGGYRRGTDGSFTSLNGIGRIWGSDVEVLGNYYYAETMSFLIFLTRVQAEAGTQNEGRSIRPLKDSTTLTHGQTGTYTGNDGKVYRTICIGTQEWVADNLAETKYRDGSDIPVVTDGPTWAALVTGAMCYYNNDISNM